MESREQPVRGGTTAGLQEGRGQDHPLAAVREGTTRNLRAQTGLRRDKPKRKYNATGRIYLEL